MVLLFGVLLHELGHAVVAGRFGMRVDGITLSWMGGVTRIEGDAQSPGAELGIAGVGPLVSVAFGAFLWVVRVLFEARGRRPAGRVRARVAGGHQRGAGGVQHASRPPRSTGEGAARRRLGRHPGPLAGHPGRNQRRGLARDGHGRTRLPRAGAGRRPLNGFFISFIGWWLLGAARTERQLGQVRQSLDGIRMSEIMRPVGSAPGWITVRAFAERVRERATRLGVDARALGRRLRRGAARRLGRRRSLLRSGIWPDPSTWPRPSAPPPAPAPTRMPSRSSTVPAPTR